MDDGISQKTFVNEASSVFTFRFVSGCTLVIRQTVRWGEFKGEGPARISVFHDLIAANGFAPEEASKASEFLRAVAKTVCDVRGTLDVVAGNAPPRSLPDGVEDDSFQVDVDHEPVAEGPAGKDLLHYMTEGPEKVQTARALMGIDDLPS